MNEEAVKELNRILAKPIRELTDDEKAFLRARRTYLKESQLKEYEDVLEPKPSPKEKTVKQNAKQTD